MQFKSSVISKARRHYSLTFFTEPTPKGRPRCGKGGRVFTPQKTRDAEALIANAIREFIMENEITPFSKEEPLRVNLRLMCKRPKSKGKGDIIPKTTKPDLDNYIKLVLDAANDTGLWDDDSQVVEILAQKVYCADYLEPCVCFEVHPL